MTFHSKRAKRLADRLRGGRTLMVTYTGEGAAYGLDDGQAVNEAAALELQADLFVRPNEDGLFPGCSQTWKRWD